MTLLLGFAHAAISLTLGRYIFIAGIGQEQLPESKLDDL